jgi:hypothetical protein
MSASMRKSCCSRSRSAPVDSSPALPIPPLAYREHVCVLNHMVQYGQARFDASFAALSDATRRGVLVQLSRADASITDLAGQFRMTITGMKTMSACWSRQGL